MTATAQVHDRLATLADPTRGRILIALERQELTVTELCAVLALPQSTASRHLKVLADDHWVTTRQEGTSRFYARNGSLEPGADRLWTVVAEDLRGGVNYNRDLARLNEVVAQRRAKSREFFADAVGSWDELRQEFFGSAVGGGALLGLLDGDWVIGDLGCGAGHLAALLVPFVGRVVGVDASPQMLEQAKTRLAGAPGVELRLGELEALPIANGELDAAVLSLVLHHVPDPRGAVAEATRVLKPGGRLLLVDLIPHDRVEYQEKMGHVWLGFSESQITEWMQGAGLNRVKVVALPTDPGAKAPGLFVASGSRRQEAGGRE
ncbi:MAG TPA: metalloregulator ArsR/SmtB family transcription factor [Gemmatimonadaceae bacterium]|nr:metalloregulator ArsR/SmtB family transcription factor [Gemmatimonadaceae bacterium]